MTFKNIFTPWIYTRIFRFHFLVIICINGDELAKPTDLYAIGF